MASAYEILLQMPSRRHEGFPRRSSHIRYGTAIPCGRQRPRVCLLLQSKVQRCKQEDFRASVDFQSSS